MSVQQGRDRVNRTARPWLFPWVVLIIMTVVVLSARYMVYDKAFGGHQIPIGPLSFFEPTEYDGCEIRLGVFYRTMHNLTLPICALGYVFVFAVVQAICSRKAMTSRRQEFVAEVFAIVYSSASALYIWSIFTTARVFSEKVSF